MFNKPPLKYLKIVSFIFLVIFVYSCKEEVSLNFTETNITKNDDVIIEINIPKAKGKTEAAKKINAALNSYVNTALNIDASNTINENTEESIINFVNEYNEFKTEINRTLFTELPVWEVLIDGEIIYKNEVIISVAMNSSINTGGAHGNLMFQFFNFDAKTGKQLDSSNLFNNIPEFSKLVKKYYSKELLTSYNEGTTVENNKATLPNQIGFNDEGVICMYFNENKPNNEVIEFIIPYTISNKYLNF